MTIEGGAGQETIGGRTREEWVVYFEDPFGKPTKEQLAELVAAIRRETARQVIDWVPERYTVTRNELRGKARAEWGP